MKKIAMFGGAFDPFHNGHLHLIQSFLERLGLDLLLLIPTAQSPHKEGERVATPEQRLAMCRLAVEGIPHVAVSDMEIRRGGKSYTVDTLRALRQSYPDAHLFLLVGTDMFLTLPEWHRYEEILSLATVCPAVRDKNDRDRLREAAAKMDADVLLEDIAPYPVSSTEIRESIRRGAPVSHLLPPVVEAYIRAQGLYR